MEKKRRIYLDNAATSWPKPQGVAAAMADFIKEIGCNPGRGGYGCSLAAGRLVLSAREKLAHLFNVPQPQQVIFTTNVTTALNYALKGLLRPGDHVIASTLEHNAVVRPLESLKRYRGVQVDFIPCDGQGQFAPQTIERAIKANTRLIVLTHASNVTGAILPVAAVAKIAKKYSLFFILDTAQTAGIYHIDFQDLNLDVLAFTGHKGLLGPPGTGGFAVSNRAAEAMLPLVEGGTGSASHKTEQPGFLPDKFESGTLNTPGIAGLLAALEFIEAENLTKIQKHIKRLLDIFLQGLSELPGVNIWGPRQVEKQVATVSITVDRFDLGELSMLLDERYGIMARSGLHCAPLAHETIGTFPTGTIRFSPGYFNSSEDIEYVLASLKEITGNLRV